MNQLAKSITIFYNNTIRQIIQKSKFYYREQNYDNLPKTIVRKSDFYMSQEGQILKSTSQNLHVYSPYIFNILIDLHKDRKKSFYKNLKTRYFNILRVEEFFNHRISPLFESHLKTSFFNYFILLYKKDKAKRNLYNILFRPRTLRYLCHGLNQLNIRIKTIDFIYTFHAKIKGYAKKIGFSKLFIENIMIDKDPKRDVLLSYLKEGISKKYIRSVGNNLDLTKDLTSLNIACKDIVRCSGSNKNTVRNVYSYKWWERKEDREVDEDKYNKSILLKNDTHYKGIWDYMKRFTSEIKEEKQKNIEEETNLKEIKTNCEKCLNGWKNENLVRTLETRLSANNKSKHNDNSDMDSSKKIEKNSTFKNLSLSVINEFSLIGNIQDEEENILRYSLRKSLEPNPSEMKKKYGVNNVFNKIEHEKKRKKDSHITSILKNLSDPDKQDPEKHDKKKSKMSTSVSRLHYPKITYSKLHDNNIGLRDDYTKEELI